MDSPYKKLQWANAEKTAILGTRHDDSQAFLESDGGDLWGLAASGHLGRVSDYSPPPPPPLSAVKERGEIAVDRAAEKWMAGREKTYLSRVHHAKVQAVARHLQGGEVEPMLINEASLREVSVEELSGSIADKAVRAEEVIQGVEFARVRAKVLLTKAFSAEEVLEAVNDFEEYLKKETGE